jgi:hypothetical protein
MAETRRFARLFLAVALAAWPQAKPTVDDLVSFVKGAILQKQDDRKVAAAVQNIRLANKLEDSTVTELQRLGAGPKTVVALRHLSEMTASLPGAAAAPVNTVPVLPPPPGPAEMKQILDESRENALNYTKKLPNYVCTQVTKRHVDPTGTGSWRLEDQILEKLTFFEQKENYKVIMVNNSPVTNDVSHEKLGGATSSGEFGSILYAIFAPETQTEFAWDRWTGLRKRWMYVFSFQTLQPIYSITHGGSKRTISTRARGSVYADRDTKMVVRIKLEAEGIPADFPIQTVSLDLNYDFTDISGQEFLLPLRSDVRSREDRYLSWNEASYISYHKFGADATIIFDTPDVPDEKLKEQPPKSDTAPGKKKN